MERVAFPVKSQGSGYSTGDHSNPIRWQMHPYRAVSCAQWQKKTKQGDLIATGNAHKLSGVTG